MRVLAIILATLAGCAAPVIDAVRYHNRDPVWVVNDRRAIERPEENKYTILLYHFDGFFHRRFTRWTEMRPKRRALGVNSFDEVPDSTWFTNRIGRREMTADEVRRGPNREPGPMARKPWTIVSSKVGGASIGFIIEDSAGDRYLLKFDPKRFPETETAADVIVARLLWACGFNVPEDYIVGFTPDELVINEGAVVKDIFGEPTPLTRAILEEKLSLINVNPDGSVRGLASRFLSGKPLGGFAREGIRADDPNDKIPHQRRRDVRGAYAIFAWLDHADIKEDNTLDMWVEDSANPEVHYVRHFYLDFGKALGVQETHNRLRQIGFSYILDLSDALKSAASLGLWKREWEERVQPRLRGVGLYDVETYQPGDWKAFTPSYFPFLDADRFDGFWASKILIRFTEPQLRAAVSEAKLTDPRAAAYLVRNLIGRQRKTARYWFSRVNPVDNLSLAGGALCFDDLTARHELEPTTATYRARGFDRGGRATGFRSEARADGSGRVCHRGVAPSGSRDGYAIVELGTDRPGRQLPPTHVHLARGPGGALRIIGIRRL
jgi:hypothetical protein